MSYTIEKQDDILLICLNDPVWSGVESYQLQDEVRVQLKTGVRKFVMDLEEVGTVNSLGIGVIVSSLVSIKNMGGKLRFCELNPRTLAAFEVSRVVLLMQMDKTRADALAGF